MLWCGVVRCHKMQENSSATNSAGILPNLSSAARAAATSGLCFRRLDTCEHAHRCSASTSIHGSAHPNPRRRYKCAFRLHRPVLRSRQAGQPRFNHFVHLRITHYSLLTTYHSRLTTHYSLFSTHYALRTTPLNSLLTIYHSLFGPTVKAIWELETPSPPAQASWMGSLARIAKMVNDTGKCRRATGWGRKW